MEKSEVKYENYIYVGKPLPEGCPIKTVQGLHIDDEIYPHRWGLKVGEDSKEFGKKSYFIKDKENNDTKLLDELLDADVVEQTSKNIMRKTEKDGEEVWVDAYVTYYYLPFEHESASFRLPTSDEPIEDAINVETDATLEVLMVTGDWSRYLTIPIRTEWPSITMIDAIDDLEDIFDEWADNKQNGFSHLESDNKFKKRACHDDCILVRFFNQMGDGDDLEFESIDDMMSCIVSLRLVNVENRITGR